MTKKIVKKEIQIGGRPLSLEYGELAAQANGAVLAKYGDTVVLATATAAKPRVESDFFPLTVDYVERLYAGGRIKGSRFVKREGRPSDEAILAGRIIDRTIRPLFPKDYRDEVQVVITVLSVDLENDPTILGVTAAAAALACSDIPWNGPAVSVKVGRKAGEKGSFILNPSAAELEFCDLDLVVAGTSEEVLMVEGGADEILEEELLKGIEFAQGSFASIIEMINEMAKEAGIEKKEIEVDEQFKHVREDVREFALTPLKEILDKHKSKEELKEKMAALSEEVFAKYEGTYQKAAMSGALDDLTKEAVRELMIKDGKRLDGRKLNEVRPLSIKVGVLPRTHGSAIFQRGETQVLTVATLGSTSLEQLIEGPTGEETKRYIHHYYFAPFSTGEVGRIGSPGRREIGHSALAERALERMIPAEEKFPYTIRIVSEVLSSNGSTSMASTCGSTLSLMDAGVPIKAPVSGVAMGLYTDGKTYRVLTDIAGIEDHTGDMDFKVAGTAKGITAVQMDLKVGGIPHKVMDQALAQAREGRLFILEEMLKVIAKPREKLSQYAPKVVFIKIPVDKIGEVIGPGGKMIKSITEATGTVIDVEEDGAINISGQDADKVAEAKKIVEDLTREIKVGEVFDGTVKRVTDFGAFVEILPGKDGLVHVSELAPGYVERVSDVVKVGDQFKVKVIGVDDQGRIKLSKRALEPGGEEPRRPRPDFGHRGPRPRFQSRYGPRQGGFSPRGR